LTLLHHLSVKDQTRVSQVILDAINKLQYKPGQGFLRKGPNKDPSVSSSKPFCVCLTAWSVPAKASRNLLGVCIDIKKQMPKIVADAQLAPFFAAL
jgi:hypothetical protein